MVLHYSYHCETVVDIQQFHIYKDNLTNIHTNRIDSMVYNYNGYKIYMDGYY